MRIRRLVFCLSLAALTLSACGKIGNSASTGIGTPAPASSTSTAATSDRLIASVAMLNASDVRGARATFSWNVERDGFHLTGNGTYLVTAEGNLQLDTHYRGDGSVPSRFSEANDSQVIVLSGAAYVLSPSLGPRWVKFMPDEFGADWDTAKRLASARSPLDYKSVIPALAANAIVLGTERIDGATYEHYRGTLDANVLMGALADSYASQGQVMFANRYSGPVATDVWIDPSTALPRRIRADGHITYLGGDTHLVVTVDYLDFHPVASIVAPPDSIAFHDLAASQ